MTLSLQMRAFVAATPGALFDRDDVHTVVGGDPLEPPLAANLKCRQLGLLGHRVDGLFRDLQQDRDLRQRKNLVRHQPVLTSERMAEGGRL